MAMNSDANTPWWRTPSGIVMLCFLAIAGFFLITEHTAHFFGALPYLLLAACPLMHLFMHHGGHGGHHHDGDDAEPGRKVVSPKGEAP